MQIFIAVSFLIAKNWTQSKFPWRNKLWYIYTNLYQQEKEITINNCNHIDESQCILVSKVSYIQKAIS